MVEYKYWRQASTEDHMDPILSVLLWTIYLILYIS